MSALVSKTHSVPRHVAIIMDGNGRWAKKRFLPRAAGHRAGMGVIEKVVVSAIDEGVETLTLFALSVENLSRPTDELNHLYALMAEGLKKDGVRLIERGVCLQVVGDIEVLPVPLRTELRRIVRDSAHNQKINLVIAVNYSGRWDICQAAKRLSTQSADASTWTVDAIASQLSTARYGDVDLLIRTGGNRRISNFVLWQAAYAELYFIEAPWPDFNAQHFSDALAAYASSQRRFGLLPDQLPAGGVHA